MSVAISIVTPTFNQAGTIAETIESVRDQRLGERLEYIVVDGCSTDDTADVVRRYAPQIHDQGIRFRYVREPDDGQADAVNKGWRLSSGKVLGFLNSDDLLEPGALERVIEYFDKHPETRWAYGGWRLVGEHGRPYRTVAHRRYDRRRLLNYCNIGQPSCFFRRELLDTFGWLDERLHLAMDYDLWLRFATRHDAGIIPHTLSSMRYHAGAKSAHQTRKQLKEILEVGKRHTRPVGFRRLMQHFYYYRGLAVVGLKVDISKRIARKQNEHRQS